jgi:hypothetical protein
MRSHLQTSQRMSANGSSIIGLTYLLSLSHDTMRVTHRALSHRSQVATIFVIGRVHAPEGRPSTWAPNMAASVCLCIRTYKPVSSIQVDEIAGTSLQRWFDVFRPNRRLSSRLSSRLTDDERRLLQRPVRRSGTDLVGRAVLRGRRCQRTPYRRRIYQQYEAGDAVRQFPYVRLCLNNLHTHGH